MAIIPKDVGTERDVMELEKTIDSILRSMPEHRQIYNVYPRFNPTEEWILGELKNSYLNAGWNSFEEIKVGDGKDSLYYYQLIAPTGAL